MKQIRLTIGEKATLDVRDAVEDSALAERLYAQGGQWGASHQAIKILSSAKDAPTLDIEGQFEGESIVRFVPQSPILRQRVGVVEFGVVVKEANVSSEPLPAEFDEEISEDARTVRASKPTPDDDEKVSAAAKRMKNRSSKKNRA